MSSVRDWTIPTAVSGVVTFVAALIFVDFAADFLFTDACLDAGGMVEGQTCIGAQVTNFGATPYVLAIVVALLIIAGTGVAFRRMSHGREKK